MTEEKYVERPNTTMRDFLIQFLFVALFIFILFWLFPTKDYVDDKVDSLYRSNFAQNVDRMKEGAIYYFINPRLPQNYGDSERLSLQEMYDLKIVLPIIDENGYHCDPHRSYVEITKVDADHYLLRIFLSCPEMEDYLHVHLGCYDYCERDICEKEKEEEEPKPIDHRPAPKPKPCPPDDPCPPKEVPAAPKLKCSTQSISQIDLQWSQVDSAKGYRLYRCTGSTCVPNIMVRSQTGTQWSDMGLSSGTTYRYRAVAYNDAGVSNYSNVVSCATPQKPVQPEPPAAPKVSCSTIDDDKIEVSWNNVTDALGYRVYRCVGGGCVPTVEVRHQLDTSWVNANLSPGTTYRYRVVAYNKAGNSNYSNTVTCSTPEEPAKPKPPKAPTVSCETISNSEIDVSWSSVSSAKGYRVYRCEGTSCTPTSLVRTQTGTSWLNSSLKEDTVYRYRVRAYNDAGNSSYSNTVTCRTDKEEVPKPPKAPTVSCETISNSEIDVSWSSVSSAKGYRVYRCEGTSCTPTSLVRTQTGTSWLNSSLKEDTVYRYRVRAYNDAGNSSYSNTVTCQTDKEAIPKPPKAPTASCETISNSQIEVSWSSISNAQGYRVYRCEGSSCTPTSLVRTQTGTNWLNSGLKEDTVYRYRVRAYNDAGNSSYSNTVTCRTDKKEEKVVMEYEYKKVEETEEVVWGSWSSWSTTAVSASALRQVETKTEEKVETRREKVKVGYRNEVKTETRRVLIGERAEISCNKWSGSQVTTRTYWQEASNSPRMLGYIPRDTSSTIYVLISVPTDGYDCDSTSCVVKKGVYKVFERRTETTTSGQNVCVSYDFKKQDLYADKVVSYNVQTPIYGYVDKEYKTTVKYYRFRQGQVHREEHVIIRWSENPYDYSLINQGFKPTGRERQKK